MVNRLFEISHGHQLAHEGCIVGDIFGQFCDLTLLESSIVFNTNLETTAEPKRAHFVGIFAAPLRY